MQRRGLLADLLAGPGNEAWDLGRFMAAGSFASLVGVQVHALIIGQTLDVLQFGTALAAVMGGAGAFIALKDRAGNNVEQAGKPVEVTNPPGEKLEVTG